MNLPKQYQWLANESAPRMLVEALKLYGTTEKAGPDDNPVILQWAKELNIGAYQKDSIPWCGLFIAIVAKNAGKGVVANPLWAANWAKWGTEQKVAMLGDVLLFSRLGGNHVGIYVGEDEATYHVLGGNQGDKVSIIRILKGRCWTKRRSKFTTGQPANIRVVQLDAKGIISTNEA